MRLKFYRAADLRAAMTRVREELGPDALILATRRVAGGVELTAALDGAADAPAPLADPARAALLAWHGVPAALADRLGAHRGPLEPALTTHFDFGALPLAPGGSPILLTGPPGAGKTLTAARLATRMVMAGGAPLMITADGCRAGATDQLAAFTRLLGLTLVVANHPVTLARALTRRHEGAPVLIDGAGLDPFEPAQRDELMALAATAGAMITLVLPAGLDVAEAGDTAMAFADAGATAMAATRFDLARRFGSVLAAADAGRLTLVEAGVGPGAADGLVPLTPALLAARLSAGSHHDRSRHAA